jgi:hypothetical protein
MENKKCSKPPTSHYIDIILVQGEKIQEANPTSFQFFSVAAAAHNSH